MRCSEAIIDAVTVHAQSEVPRECCGILLGSAHEITHALPARNLSDDPHRFLIEPQDHLAARRTARARGLEVIGFYHSHPHSAAVPSATDCAEVTYDGCVYLIVSLVAAPAVRLFRMDLDGPIELDLTFEAGE